MAYAHNPKGIHFAKIGQVLSAKEDPLVEDGLRGQRLWLLPEEVIYMLERGSLDVRWPASDVDESGNGLPMSLQGAYAMFIGDEARPGTLTLEKYSVYAGLKRAGYTVLRAPTWNAPDLPLGSECFPPRPQRTWMAGLSSFIPLVPTWFYRDSSTSEEHRTEGPLVQDSLYRSYADIYRKLALVRFHDPTLHFYPTIPYDDDELDSANPEPSLRVTYHVWKPGSQTFKKSAPGPPDFRVAVINARETTVPTLEQLASLLETTPYDPPPPTSQLYQKLKHGYKNVILAVVDQGVTSYLRIADAAFGREKLYERKGKMPGGKRGGRGGRGRGR